MSVWAAAPEIASATATGPGFTRAWQQRDDAAGPEGSIYLLACRASAFHPSVHVHAVRSVTVRLPCVMQLQRSHAPTLDITLIGPSISLVAEAVAASCPGAGACTTAVQLQHVLRCTYSAAGGRCCH